MKYRTKNKEVNPRRQKQVHEKKRQGILWSQHNLGNKRTDYWHDKFSEEEKIKTFI